MALVAGEFKSGGRVVDRFGRDSLKAETPGSALSAGDYKSGGVVRDADGRIVVVAETLNAAVTAGSVRSGGRLFDDKGRLIVASSSVALVSGEVLSGGEVLDSAGRVVLTSETLDAAYSAGDIDSGGSARSSFGRRLVAGLAAFTPLSLSPAFWYDFSLLAGADGSAISTFNDSSGNGRTITQATGTAQPLVKAGVNGINSLKVALFDGVDDTLNSASFSLAQPFVLYAVITGNGGGPGRYFSSNDLAARAGYNLSNQADNFAGSTLVGGTTNATNPKVVTSVFNGVSSLIRIDGTQVAAGDVGAGAIATGINVGTTAGLQPFAGKIGEMFLVPGAAVSTAAEAYLKAKWGTP